MGWVFLALVVAGFVVTNFVMKMGSLKGHSSATLTGSLFSVSSFFCFLFLLFLHQPLHISLPVVLLAVGGGVGGAVAYFFFLSALKIGNYALTISIYTMTFLIPVVFSVIFWKRSFGTILALGIIFIVIGIALISTSGSTAENKRTGLWLRWLLFLAAAFLLAGIPQLSQAAAVRLSALNLWFYLFLTFLFGALAFMIFFAAKKIRLDGNVFSFGALAAAGSVAGNFFTLKALTKLPETIVFPVVLSAPVVAAVLLSLLFFREKIRLTGYLGIVIGLAGIVLLMLK